MVKWTEQQLLAITKTGCDLLVSASAGSGKTAVLVERVLHLATQAVPPANLSQFLIVTFTEAAASEMRGRIGATLRERLAESPHDEHLRHQILLLPQAQISTIHAFCSSVLRRHFHHLGIDPEFGLLSEEEALILRTDAADSVVKDQFHQANPAFHQWIDSFGGPHPETALRDQVLALHDFMQSIGDRREWTDRVRAAYPLLSDGTPMALQFEEHAWFAAWRREMRDALDILDASMRQARAHVNSQVPPKYVAWLDQVEDMLKSIGKAFGKSRYDDAIGQIQQARIPRLPAKPPNQEEPFPRLKQWMGEIKETFKDMLLDDLALYRTAQASEAHARTGPVVHLMLDLTAAFADAYALLKRRRAALDFSDLEQMCLQALRDPEQPENSSHIALQYRDLFEYVMVDEYQDINPVQDAILNLVSRRGPMPPGNLFAVGDVKQCIYKFRLAAPEIFLQKYNAFAKAKDKAAAEGAGRRIDLSANFRSRANILHAANSLFERLMSADTVGLDYAGDVLLIPGAGYPDSPTCEPSVELHLFEPQSNQESSSEFDSETDEEESEEPPDRIEMEATLVGKHILRLVHGDADMEPLQVFDRDLPTVDSSAGGAMRPVEFRDIVILMRSLSDPAQTYASVLRNMGIPVSASLNTGYFAAPEIQDMLNLLQVIDNLLQDIPLAAVLRSPMENWSADELAEVRIEHPDLPFHEAFRALADKPKASPTGRKASQFLQRIDEWRTRARRGPLGDLLAAIYDATAYPAFVGSLADGAIRRANLESLHHRACQFDQFSRQGLSRFLQFMDQLQNAGKDLAPAAAPQESRNLVRLMTIHKSKGQEFPVVFLVGLGRKFNLRDKVPTVTFSSKEPGIAAEVIDLERGVRYPSPGTQALRRRQRREDLAEELRVLYVAVTRARERLLLYGACPKAEETIDRWRGSVETVGSGPMPAQLVFSTQNPLQWIGRVISCENRGAEALAGAASSGQVHDCRIGKASIRIACYGPDQLRRESPMRELSDSNRAKRENLLQIYNSAESENDPVQAAMRRINWSYPHEALASHPARISMAALKERMLHPSEEEERIASLLPEEFHFSLPKQISRSGETPSGAERGTWTHFVLERLDLLRPLDYADLSAQIDSMIDRGILTEAQREALDIESIETFFASPLGKRLLALPPDRVWRELPFTIGLRPSEIGIDDLAQYDAAEIIQAQGVIDCLLSEPDGLVLIDYKTDSVQSEEAARARAEYYRPQIQIYRRAIQSIFFAPLREAHLHFLTPRISIRMWDGTDQTT